jgi:hypothetical protein
VKAVPFWKSLKWEPQHLSCSDLRASCIAPTCTMSQVFIAHGSWKVFMHMLILDTTFVIFQCRLVISSLFFVDW